MPREDTEAGGSGAVTPPPPPDDSAAWYAPDVHSQTEVHPGVVVTIRESEAGFAYEVREPALTDADERALERVTSYFADANLDRPRTREGAVERMAAGFDPKHRRVIARLIDASPAARRRIEYHALADIGCLGRLTPYALDDRIDVVETTDRGVVVHTDDFAPATTGLPPEPAYVERFASDRLERHTVSFHGFEIPVVVYRENVLGADPFTTKYTVREPDLLPGDADLIAEAKERIWETDVDGVVDDSAAFVRRRAREILSRRLTAKNTRAWLDAARYRVRSALAEWGLAVPPVDERYAEDRLDDLVYYVLRDYVGYGKLTIPIRDETLEDVEANRVGERVKVVPRESVGHGERIPADLTFEDEREFVNVVKQLAADDGAELNASNPSAKVNLSPPGVEGTIRCAVALPTVSEGGPHISVRKQAPDVLTPVDLLERDSLPTELVALLWQLYEHHGVVLFCGPTGVGKTTLMNAHMPFISYRDRPVSIDEGSREVWLPHETGVSLTTRDHQDEYKQVTMADLMTETNYLNPDVELIAEVNTPESFETFAEVLNTGHGVIGTTHAGDVETLVNRVVEQGLPTYLLDEVDLLVFPRHTDGERYVGEVVELVDESDFREFERDESRCGVVRKGGTTVHWNTVLARNSDGSFEFAYEHPALGDETRRVSTRVFDRLATLTDRSAETVEAEFHRKHGYVEYLEREGVTDGRALFAFLADLQTEEAATVERIRRQRGLDGSASNPSPSVPVDDAETPSRNTHAGCTPSSAGRSRSSTADSVVSDGRDENDHGAAENADDRASVDGDTVSRTAEPATDTRVDEERDQNPPGGGEQPGTASDGD